MRSSTSSTIAGAGMLLALAGACGEGGSAPGGARPGAIPPLASVVADRLAALAAEVGELPPLEPPADPEEVAGLVGMLASATGRMRQVPLEAVRADLGAPAGPLLAVHLRDERRPSEERVAAAELLAALDEPRAAETLVATVESAPEPWLRAWCAYHLAATGQDWIEPRLVLRLKVERDPATWLWIASTLARFDNFSGLAGLEELAATGATEELRAQAQGQLDALAARLGRTPGEVRALWDSIEAAGALPQARPSARLRLAVWRAVAELSGEHFQLRGVDDARHALSQMGPWVAEEIAPALFDRDPFVRLHTAQVLERMGPRATTAGPQLVAALGEPTIAPAAAEALGRVGYPAALASLLDATAAGRPHELRVAAARGLGRLGLEGGLARVSELFAEASSPPDLRAAAATALVLLGRGDDAARWLVDELAAGEDPSGAERALETWLERGARSGRAGFEAALGEWRSLAGPPGVIPDLAQTRERWTARAAALRARLDGLLAARGG